MMFFKFVCLFDGKEVADEKAVEEGEIKKWQVKEKEKGFVAATKTQLHSSPNTPCYGVLRFITVLFLLRNNLYTFIFTNLFMSFSFAWLNVINLNYGFVFNYKIKCILEG